MQGFKRILFCMLAILLFTSSLNLQAVEAATTVKKSSSIFGEPKVVDNKVKITLSGTVKAIKHSKYLDSEHTHLNATKQLNTNGTFSAFSYSCPGHYITRVYSDKNATKLIGYIYVFVSTSDINNTGCEQLYDNKTAEPTKPLNATHPVATVKEPSKTVPKTTTVTETKPFVVENPTVIKSEDKTEVIQPTAEQQATYEAELSTYNENQTAYQACIARNEGNGNDWTLVNKQSGSSPGWNCVNLGDCEFNNTLWYCGKDVRNFANEKAPTKPTAQTVTNTIPSYDAYAVAECDDATSDECSRMDIVDHNMLPTGEKEPTRYGSAPVNDATFPDDIQFKFCKLSDTEYQITEMAYLYDANGYGGKAFLMLSDITSESNGQHNFGYKDGYETLTIEASGDYQIAVKYQYSDAISYGVTLNTADIRKSAYCSTPVWGFR